MKRCHETAYEVCPLDSPVDRPSILSTLPVLDELRLRAMQLLYKEDVAQCEQRQLSPVGTLQQQILAASLLVPPALRVEAQRLEALKSRSPVEVAGNRLLMAEALSCLAGFHPPIGQSQHDEAAATMPHWSQGSLPGLIEGDLEVMPPCTPDQITCEDDGPWIPYEQTHARPSASRENRSMQGANKTRRTMSMTDVTQRTPEPTPLLFMSSLPSDGFHMPTRSAILGSVIRDMLEPSNEEGKAQKCEPAKEYGCSQTCGAHFESADTVELQDSICEHQTVRCKLCGQRCPLRQLAMHTRHLCSQVEAVCPNEGCDWKGRREFLKMHVEEICAAVVVPCSFEASGCPVHVTRGNLRSHMIEELHNHVLLLAQENRLLRTHLYKMNESQTLLQTRLENLETVVMLPDEPEEDDTSSVCSSASFARN